MRAVLTNLILAYQRIAPTSLRERCIFAESCSNFVLRKLRDGGVRSGLVALASRARRCRPGYFRLPASDLYPGVDAPVRLADGSIVDRSELSPRVVL
jgi:putative component of membrane protein insertase Oxa1/YidC/SpoIIIJ protein YidD